MYYLLRMMALAAFVVGILYAGGGGVAYAMSGEGGMPVFLLVLSLFVAGLVLMALSDIGTRLCRLEEQLRHRDQRAP